MQATTYLPWTQEKFQQAAERGYYIGVPRGLRFLLSGAPRVWSDRETRDFYYNSGYRIVGTPADIQTALTRAGIPRATIDEVLRTSFTRNNYQTTMRDAFQQALNPDMTLHRGNADQREAASNQAIINILNMYIDDAKNNAAQLGNDQMLYKRAYREVAIKLHKLKIGLELEQGKSIGIGEEEED